MSEEIKTIKDLIKIIKPSAIQDGCFGSVAGCPNDFEVLKEYDYNLCKSDVISSIEKCNKCWEQKLNNKLNNLFNINKNKETVNHPAHYNQGKFECIDVMVETFGINATVDFCKLNAFKYLWRSNDKNGIEDIKKAVWYLNKIIEFTKESGKINEPE